MSTITRDYLSDGVNKVAPISGNRSGFLSPDKFDASVLLARETYTAEEAIALDKNLVMLRFDHPVVLIAGSIFVSGASATTTVDVGVVPVSSLSDAAIDVLGDAVPVGATPGQYSLLGGLTSGTGEPASRYYEITEPSYIVVHTNTAGLTLGAVVKLDLQYVKKFS